MRWSKTATTFSSATSRGRKASLSIISFQTLMTHFLWGLICFYLGMLMGMTGSSGNPDLKSATKLLDDAAASQCSPCDSSGTTTTSRGGAFPTTIKNFFTNYTTVDRLDLGEFLDLGVPLDDNKPGAEEALILYTSPKSQPKSPALLHKSKWTAAEATENCQTLKVVLTQPFDRSTMPECWALMPQWESYHVYKYMRLPRGRRGGLDLKEPLRSVSRSHNNQGRSQAVPEYERHTKPSYDALVEYLQHLDETIEALKPLLQALNSKSIIVLVCNYGQVELFINFLCNAKAKGIETTQVFMFATDLKTYELCQAMGIPAYFNERIFGSMPEQAAKGYGDRVFTKMMMAKVYCVHLVLTCGYNVLFQDVDLIWYKNPLQYLEAPEFQEWDFLFQDDGARSNRYSPFSPNTGFYYVRHNALTMFFFGMLMRQGDVVARTSSHQAALNALLNEHVNWKGLRVKVFKKGASNPFPGGLEYHRQKELMKTLLKRNQYDLQIRAGKTPKEQSRPTLDMEPYVFHMSWTKNKDNKKLYFQQMGEWYLKAGTVDACGGWDCCLPEPNIVCHYRDKPSIIPCKDSPPIDAGKPSFW